MHIRRTSTLDNIPREFFEQADDPLITEDVIDRLYEHLPQMAVEGQVTILEICDDDVIAGVIVLQPNVLTSTLSIVFTALKDEYKGKLDFPRKLTEFASEYARQAGCSRITGCSKRAKTMERFGWTATNQRIMYKEV